jgi:hypothetical protein
LYVFQQVGGNVGKIAQYFRTYKHKSRNTSPLIGDFDKKSKDGLITRLFLYFPFRKIPLPIECFKKIIIKSYKNSSK